MKKISYMPIRLNSKAVSLTELLIALIICSIIILVIGSISSISQTSFENLRKESQVYADLIYYGFDLIKNSARQASSLGEQYLTNPSDGQWVGKALIVDNSAFVKFQNNESPTTFDFVHLPNKNDLNQRDTILAKADNLNFNFTISGKLLTVTLQGNKGNNQRDAFDFTSSVMKRN